MSQIDYYNNEFKQHAEIIENTRVNCQAGLEAWLGVSVDAVNAGKKILFFGNGGSASDAQHLATELSIRYLKDRAPIAAICLNTDTSTLTAAGNDLGFDMIFARQIEAIGQKGDVVVGISTSGNSENILKAMAQARQQGLTTVGLIGRDGGKMKSYCDITVIVPSDYTPRIQEMHITLGHIYCGALERELGLVNS